MGEAAAMQGDEILQDSIFSFLSPESGYKRPSAKTAAQMVNRALQELSPSFQAMYSSEGRPFIPPELSQFSSRRGNNN
jgi:hypothetical protein